MLFIFTIRTTTISTACLLVPFEPVNTKLIEIFESGNVELYDLENDPGETNDLSNSQPFTDQKILNKLKNWQKQSASMPTPNPDYIEEKISEGNKQSPLKKK